jgi:DUF971 family protein
MEPTSPPTSIQRFPGEQTLLVAWADGLQTKLNLIALRAQCMCARCVDEITGERIIDTDGIDPAIQIDQLQLVGNYALRIHWSDGHHQGLYTWEHLRRLCEPTS